MAYWPTKLFVKVGPSFQVPLLWSRNKFHTECVLIELSSHIDGKLDRLRKGKYLPLSMLGYYTKQLSLLQTAIMNYTHIRFQNSGIHTLYYRAFMFNRSFYWYNRKYSYYTGCLFINFQWTVLKKKKTKNARNRFDNMEGEPKWSHKCGTIPNPPPPRHPDFEILNVNPPLATHHWKTVEKSFSLIL